MPVARFYFDTSVVVIGAGSLVDLSHSLTAQIPNHDQCNLALDIDVIPEPGMVSPVTLAGLAPTGGVELSRNG